MQLFSFSEVSWKLKEGKIVQKILMFHWHLETINSNFLGTTHEIMCYFANITLKATNIKWILHWWSSLASVNENGNSSSKMGLVKLMCVVDVEEATGGVGVGGGVGGGGGGGGAIPIQYQLIGML